MPETFAWTEERIETLKTMWEAGAPASEIAATLNGVSRNAVIGKAHRLGLQARPSPVKEAKAMAEGRAAAAAQAAEPEPAPPPPAQVAASLPLTITPPTAPPAPNDPVLRSIGPGGFLRQGPGDQQPPIPPAPPRRLVPAKPSADMADKTSLLELNDKICKWPLGHPGEPDFHFCGKPVNPGFPYCVAHCGQAYQAQLPRRDRRPPPPLPFGGPRVR